MKIELLKNVRAKIFDVDGVLTDGNITLDANGEEIKSFNVRDGQLIKFMQFNGYFLVLFLLGSLSYLGRDLKN